MNKLIVQPTPGEQLRSACKALNDANGRGGQKALALRLGISTRGLRFKLVGKSRIFEGDLAIAREVLSKH